MLTPPRFETCPWRWMGFAEVPWLVASDGFSFVLHEGDERYSLTLADLTYREGEEGHETEGLFVGFDRRTGWGEWRSPGGGRVEAGVHRLQYPGEPAWHLEVEFRAPGGEVQVSDVRFRLRASAEGVQAAVLSGPERYAADFGSATYVLPFFSDTWQGALAELAEKPPARNCGHLALTRGDKGVAVWYPAGHHTDCGGRSGYVHMPLEARAEGGAVELAIPLYTPGHGTDREREFDLAAGVSHRPFGLVLTAGGVEGGDPWSLVRAARRAALRREPAGSGRLFPPACSTWTWPPIAEEHSLPEERALVRRHPFRAQRAGLGNPMEGRGEDNVRAMLPYVEEMGCSVVWIDIDVHPIHGGNFAEVAEKYPGGLLKLRQELRERGMEASFILMPDSLSLGEQWPLGDLTPEQEAQWGRYRQTCPHYMCMASPWAEHAGDELGQISRDYELALAQIAFSHNSPHRPDQGCQSAEHGHAPAAQAPSDYGRGYYEGFNRLYRRMRELAPRTLILENLPTVYDLGNPQPDAIWVADTFHFPPYAPLMLEYMAAQRLVWPMEMRFMNFVALNLESQERSLHLLANIALGNQMALGEDWPHMPPRLKTFCRFWLDFYRRRQGELCDNLQVVSPQVFVHRTAEGYLVFLLNAEREPRRLGFEVSGEEDWPGRTVATVREHHEAGPRERGEVALVEGRLGWEQEVGAEEAVVLEFVIEG